MYNNPFFTFVTGTVEISIIYCCHAIYLLAPSHSLAGVQPYRQVCAWIHSNVVDSKNNLGCVFWDIYPMSIEVIFFLPLFDEIYY